MPASADSKNKRVANSSSVTHQTVRQQGGTGEDSHIHLADWALSVAAIEKKKTRRVRERRGERGREGEEREGERGGRGTWKGGGTEMEERESGRET